MRPIFRNAAVLLLGAAALTAAVVTPAKADPAGPTNIAIVGSDVNEILNNDLASAYNSAYPTNPTVGSWNSTNPTTGANGDQITIKSGQPAIYRPNGSDYGITALKYTSYVDIASSSRGPRTGDTDPVTGLPLAFVRVAQDTVQYALSQATPTNGSPKLTGANLKTVYQTSGETWNQVDATNTSTAAIVPMLPQMGSGTRSFFLSSIGVDDCVLGTTTNGVLCSNGFRSDVTIVQDSDYTPIQNNADAIAPFSLARYRTLPAPIGIRLESPGGYSAVRFVYNVVRNAGTATAPAVPANLQAFLGNNDTTGYICNGGSNIITQDGFEALTPFDCGVIDHI